MSTKKLPIAAIKLIIAEAYGDGIKHVCERLVVDGAISQYKADMLIEHGADWVDDGLENAN